MTRVTAVAPATPENIRILREMDVTAFIALLPPDAQRRARNLPDDERRETMLNAMHKARYELTGMDKHLRQFSRKWLEQRGLTRMRDLPWPPTDVLPSKENGL